MFFFLTRSAAPRDLHSFPTRRSSDLDDEVLPFAADEGERGNAGEIDQLRGCCQPLPHGGNQRLPAGDVTRVAGVTSRSEEHTSELQSRVDLVCRLLLEKKKNKKKWQN